MMTAKEMLEQIEGYAYMREPSMTRRHFELIANVIDALSLDGFGHNVAPAEIRLNIAQDFSRVFEGVNKSFDRAMFINACTKSDRKRAERKVGKHPMLAAGYGSDGKLTKRAATAAKPSSDPTTWDDDVHHT